jgi:hypothetical protein
MVPATNAIVVALPECLAAKAHEAQVLAVWDDDDLVVHVYCTWTPCGDGYVVADRVNTLTWDDYGVIQDAVTRARGRRVMSDSADMIAASMAAAAQTRSGIVKGAGRKRRRKVKPEDPRLVAGPDARHEEV